MYTSNLFSQEVVLCLKMHKNRYGLTLTRLRGLTAGFDGCFATAGEMRSVGQT